MNNLLETIAVALTKLAADQAEYLVWAKQRDEEALQIQRQHLELMLEQEERWRIRDEFEMAKVQDE